MKKIQAVLFDFDGVIMDTYASYRQIVVDVLQSLNYEITLDDAVNRWKGMNAEQIARELSFEGFEFTEKFLEDTHKKAKSYHVNESMLVEGVIDVLEKTELPKSICSNGRSIRLKSNLDDVKIGHYFTDVIGRDIAKSMKPNPDVYLEGAEKLGLEIENCLAVEDSVVGLQAAVDSGAVSVAFTGTGGKKEILEKLNPDYIIDNMIELLDIIEKENKN